MLKPISYVAATELDEMIFSATVPQDHYLCKVKAAIDFEGMRQRLVEVYCPDQGRPAIEPLLLLKLEFLEYHYRLSDRRVIDQAHYNMAFRWFLDLSLNSALPHHTLLTYFRQRLGAEKHQALFDHVVGQARERGLVKDRLRLKDASHVIANIAIPSTIRLVAQTRDRLLASLRPWVAERVAEEEQQAEAIRTATADLADEERLLQRVVQLRRIVAWAEEVQQRLPELDVDPKQRQSLEKTLDVVHKVLADRQDPEGKNKLQSVHDPDARRAKHGDYYSGYLLDISMDAESEILTALNVLPGGSNEGADAATLLHQEEQTHGNKVEAISMDSAGYQGPVLHELTEPEGLNVEVFTPPKPVSKAKAQAECFGAEQFTLDKDGTTLTCPAGQTTTKRRRSWRDTGWSFRWDRTTCGACPLLEQCMPKLPQTHGRTVIKSDYEAEFRAAQAKAQTPEYAAVRRQHGAVERKLGELMRWHGARRARYWGQPRVLLQGLLTGMVVNIKRLVKLAHTTLPKAEGEGTLRAGLATGT